jgi:GNAT superfamily N-acetyltransferase
MSPATNAIVAPFEEERDCIEELTRLLNGAYGRLSSMGLNYVAATQTASITRKRIRSATACWVARGNGRIVGTICYYALARDHSEPAWYRDAGVCHFGQFAVAPECQRSGIGTLLMQRAEQQAVADGKTEFACDTAESAAHLLDYYTRLGFRIVDRHQWPHANYLSVILSKALKRPNATLPVSPT